MAGEPKLHLYLQSAPIALPSPAHVHLEEKSSGLLLTLYYNDLCNYFIMGPGRVPGLGTQEIFTEGVIGKSHLRGETLESVI